MENLKSNQWAFPQLILIIFAYDKKDMQVQ